MPLPPGLCPGSVGLLLALSPVSVLSYFIPAFLCSYVKGRIVSLKNWCIEVITTPPTSAVPQSVTLFENEVTADVIN